MNKDDEIINKLRDCEDNALTNFRVERERINGKQEGYQEAMAKAREVIREILEN